MSIGAHLYAYRSNFGGEIIVASARPYKQTFTARLIDVLRPGYRLVSRYDDDLFVHLCQHLMKLGYPKSLLITDSYEKGDGINEFLSKALFSIDPFHAQNLFINSCGFELETWRKQFDLFSETTFTKLNYYRNRAVMPIPPFRSFSDTKRNLFHIESGEKLPFKFNSCHPKAVFIKDKSVRVAKDEFAYIIEYGYAKDTSGWTVKIYSEPSENYIDFMLRIATNYEAIIAGDKSVLASEWHEEDEVNFYLGGEFHLRRPEISEAA